MMYSKFFWTDLWVCDKPLINQIPTDWPIDNINVQINYSVSKKDRILINYLIWFQVGYCIKYGAFISLLCMVRIDTPLCPPHIAGFTVKTIANIFFNFLGESF